MHTSLAYRAAHVTDIYITLADCRNCLFLWNPKTYDCVHKNPILDHVLFRQIQSTLSKPVPPS
jgi:hypothetical protein